MSWGCESCIRRRHRDLTNGIPFLIFWENAKMTAAMFAYVYISKSKIWPEMKRWIKISTGDGMNMKAGHFHRTKSIFPLTKHNVHLDNAHSVPASKEAVPL